VVVRERGRIKERAEGWLGGGGKPRMERIGTPSAFSEGDISRILFRGGEPALKMVCKVCQSAQPTSRRGNLGGRGENG